jgi:hypothetical protein
MKAEKKQKEYFVSHLGQHMGPWTLDEIAQRMSEHQLIATDFIYDEHSADWVALNKHEALLELISKAFKPTAIPLKEVQPTAKPLEIQSKSEPELIVEATPERRKISEHPENPSLNESWFVQKETHRFGPLTSIGVVKALQEKTIYDYEFIWREGMGEWIRIAEHPDFSVENIRELISKPSVKQVFIKREHPRITFMNEVMVHDDNSLWMGQAYQGGEGGSGLIIQNATLQPGQVVKLHFAAHDGLSAFNVSGEIVSKKFVKELKNKKTPVPYGVKFVGLDKKLQNTLHEYFTYKTQPGWMFAGK